MSTRSRTCLVPRFAAALAVATTLIAGAGDTGAVVEQVPTNLTDCAEPAAPPTVEERGGSVRVERPNGPAAIGVGRLTFAPGATWDADVRAGTMTLAVEAGELTVALSAGSARIGTAPVPLLNGGPQRLLPERTIVLGPGDWLALATGAAATACNSGEQPAVAQVWREVPVAPPVFIKLGSGSSSRVGDSPIGSPSATTASRQVAGPNRSTSSELR